MNVLTKVESLSDIFVLVKCRHSHASPCWSVQSSEFLWGPIQPAPQPLWSLKEATRSSPIRRRPCVPGTGSRRVVHARPRGVLVATATTCRMIPAHPAVMESSAHDGTWRRTLFHSLPVRLAGPICRTDTSVSLRSPVPCLTSR